MKNLNTRYAFLVMAILGNTNLYFSLFIIHFFIYSAPLQSRTKSVANPI